MLIANIKLFFGLIGTGWVTTWSKGQPRMAPMGLIPWDGFPGGTSSASSRAGGKFGSSGTSPSTSSSNTFGENILNAILRYTGLLVVDYNFNITFQQDIFTTVPVNSSLDIQNPTAATWNKTHIFPIDGRANSTAVKYIANESFLGNINGTAATLYNYPHADFTKRQALWMYNEMENMDNATN